MPTNQTANHTEGQTIYDEVHKTLTLPLQSDYSALLTIGTPKTNIKLMPALHTHRTFITSTNCLRCKSKAFDPANSTSDEFGIPGESDHLEYLFDHYGTALKGFAVTGEAMRDRMCLRIYNETLKQETSDICSLPGLGIEFFSVWDYKHDQNLTLFNEMPFDGILGLGAPTTDKEYSHSFT